MQRIANYLNLKSQIVENLNLLSPIQALYMEKYIMEGMDTPQIAKACGRERSTVSRTLQRGWAKLRLAIVDPKEVTATFTFNDAGDIIGMRASRTAVLGQRGRTPPAPKGAVGETPIDWPKTARR